jgi:TonB-linked SusC/RagA family outer membrane protein
MRYTQIIQKALVVFFILIANLTYAQSVIITGTVRDGLKDPLPGVNIVEVDANGRFVSGSTTDFNGNFSLRVSSDKAKVQVSFIGFKSHVFIVGNKTRYDIVLEDESLGLDEVLITAERMGSDGVTSIRDRATAVSRLEFEDIKVAQTTTVEEMLQGRIGNVDITSVSGDPGAGLNIRIRGTASLNASNEPLIVVNGIPYTTSVPSGFDFASADIDKFGSLIDVSPDDIESIEVLKDAASTAMYGTKASNGVLMIKTKRGVKSKPIFEYSMKFTGAKQPNAIPMLDGAGYARLIKEAHFNNDAGTFQSLEIDFDPTWDQYHNFAQNTDWIQEVTQIGYTTDQNFSVRGGGDKSRYKMSLGYIDEQGTTIETGLKKINISTSLDYDLSSKLSLQTDIMFTRYEQDANIGDIRGLAYRKMPNMAVYELDTAGNQLDSYFTPIETIQGQGNSMFNPVAQARLGFNKTLSDNTRAGFVLRYRILPNLVYSGSITFDIFDRKTFSFLPYEAVGYQYNSDATNRSTETYNKTVNLSANNRLVYNPKLEGGHELTILGLLETTSSNSRGFSKQSSRSGSPYLQDVYGDARLSSFGASSSTSRNLGTFVSGNYKYLDKYIFTAGVRYEGNSKLSRVSRWGFFPMTSMAWRVSEEPFMQSLRFINDLRIRGSWGLSGNMPSGNYLYYSTYSASSNFAYMGVSGVRPDGIELTSLKWETIEQYSPGITFFGFKNRLNIEFDVYTKRTRDLYLNNSRIPSTSGYSTLSQNGGEMLNKGWEFMLDAKVVQNKNLNISFNFNMSHNENVVLSLPENYTLEVGNMLANGNYRVKIEPGVPVGGFYGYIYDGVYATSDDVVVKDRNNQPVYDIDGREVLIMRHGSGYEFEAGDAKYRDTNYDGVIDELDIVLLGDYNPNIMGGIGPRIQYKNVTFNCFFYYRLGQDIVNQTSMNIEKMYNHDNQSRATNWRWRSPGDETDVPRALYNKGYNWLGSSRFVEDASFIRLKTVSLSYNFGKKACQKLNITDMRAYVTAYNLFTWTNYSGQDPEVGIPGNPQALASDNSRTPPSRRVTLGLNIKF